MPEPTEAERALIDKVAGTKLALVQAVAGRGGMSLKAFNASGRPAMVGGALFGEIAAVRQELCAPDDDRTLVLEVLRTETGHRLSRTFDLRDISPAEVILDPGHRHPNHPLAGMPRPEGAEVTEAPTDPAVLAEVGALVGEYTALYTSLKGREPTFGGPRTEEEILAAETAMGVRLPEDLRALHRTVRGDRYEHGLLGAHSPLPLEGIVEWYLEGDPGTSPGDDRLFPVTAVVFDAEPPGRVRRVSRDDWWVTFAVDGGGNSCAVDLDPGPEGERGQVLEHGRDFHGPAGYVAASVTDLLRQVVEALRAGDHDDERESDRLGLGEHVGRSTEADYRPSHTVGANTTAEIVAGIAEPLQAQMLYLNDGDLIEPAALAPLANLRALSINRAGRVATALPHELPVESLSLTAKEADLGGLAGHPTLWQLELGGLTAPVDVADLAALPALSALDLSQVTVTDIEGLADLTGLRVLTLDADQWRRLRETDRVPPRLAAARMAGRCLLAEAVEWQEWLTAKISG